MDMLRNRNKKFNCLNNQKGQSTVEYVLLLAMVMILVNTVFQSRLFKKIFGENGTFAKAFRSEVEFSYRHALRGRAFYTEPNYNNRHKSYLWEGNSTRFFGAKDKYPK